MAEPSPPAVDLAELCRWAVEESLLFADGRSPFRAACASGDARLVVLAGENASGKSLFFRLLCAKVAAAGPLPVTLSIRERAGAGTSGVGGLRRVMMFGDEAEQSTGATSVKAVAAAFGSNLDRTQGSVLGLDEPELGLSDGYARALGTYLGEQTRQLPAACSGVVVVTHSRPLVAAMVDAYGTRPTFVRCGAEGADLDEWLDEVEVRTVGELLSLAEVGLERWRATSKLLES